MKLEGKVAVVTGAASGIGRALARRFSAEGAAGVVCADRQAAGVEAVADEIGGVAVVADVSSESAVGSVVSCAEERFGRVDVFCSNAGIALFGDENTPDDDWRRSWDIHVMAHVYAARAVIPGMIERGSGYLVNTSSAAGPAHAHPLGDLRGNQACRRRVRGVPLHSLRTSAACGSPCCARRRCAPR